MDELAMIISIELTSFFSNNPFARDTCAGIARRLGRDVTLVREALEGFVEKKILAKTGEGPNIIYKYLPPYSTL